jgi:hypothetical protein
MSPTAETSRMANCLTCKAKTKHVHVIYFTWMCAICRLTREIFPDSRLINANEENETK